MDILGAEINEAKHRLRRVGLAFVFAVMGSLIIIVFSQYRPILSGIFDLLGRFGIILFLLAATMLARRSKTLHAY